MKESLSDYDYNLPKELIAQQGSKKREESRLLVYEKGNIFHKRFKQILEFLNKDDVLVINETKVSRALLVGRKSTGGAIKVTLLKRMSERIFKCLVQGRKPKEGTIIIFDDYIQARILKKESYNFEIEFNRNPDYFIKRNGQIVLPPYIKNPLKNPERYQTVYAHKEGSIAAPTAGLHFSKELIEKLKEKSVRFAKVCLNVGLGTFEKIKNEDYTKHEMHSEYFEIDKENADIINQRKGRLIIVGTTSLRALESSCNQKGVVEAIKNKTNLFIYPGYRFKLDFQGMITNFHLPRTSLLLLVAAIIGREELLRCYKVAIQERYRFYSLGDAMLILR